MKIEETELPRRLWNKLRSAGIETVDDLCQRTEWDLMRTRIGLVQMKQIRKMLAGMGKSLKERDFGVRED